MNERHARGLMALAEDYIDSLERRFPKEFYGESHCLQPLIEMIPFLVKLLNEDSISASCAAKTLHRMMDADLFRFQSDFGLTMRCRELMCSAATDSGAVRSLVKLVRNFARSLDSYFDASIQSDAAKNAAETLCTMMNLGDADDMDILRGEILKTLGTTATLAKMPRRGPSSEACLNLLDLLTCADIDGESFSEATIAACTGCFDLNVLRHLAAGLDGSYDEKRSAAEILKNLSIFACMTDQDLPDYRDLIRNAGAIPKLVALLNKDENWQLQSASANSLYFLIAGQHAGRSDFCVSFSGEKIRVKKMSNVANREAVRAAGAIPLLAPLTHHGSRPLISLANDLNVATEIWSLVRPLVVSKKKEVCNNLLIALVPAAKQQLNQAVTGTDVAKIQTMIDAGGKLLEILTYKKLEDAGWPQAYRCLGDAQTRIRELNKEAEDRRQLAEAGLSALSYPDDFCCPITKCRFEDPVVASDGHTYERSAIAATMQEGNGLSPLTRARLEPSLFPNQALLRRMRSYQAETLQIGRLAVASGSHATAAAVVNSGLGEKGERLDPDEARGGKMGERKRKRANVRESTTNRMLQDNGMD
eukprot:CAMPEP_0194334070 /NCGR_PEP_ID=MMETSP0171-20130528/64897_1 /TAXON_ID=218684 /ORGANISM="Corethron pennatum, Strain L29A3" /LENGTH=588 /DNA_ID=CAMNT_0039096577 /DNA_START=57 /DNA_END=1823 /DNA_ORIENTATION=+